jgi:hypothetical protein
MAKAGDVIQESWDFLIDLNQVPYNQKISIAKLNLELKRKVDEIDKKLKWVFDRAYDLGKDMYMICVNTKEDANRIRGITLEFEVCKGNPIMIKLEERKAYSRYNPEEWNQAVWVRIEGTYGNSYRGKGSGSETALNLEDDKNFDLVMAPFGKILQPCRTDRMIIEDEDEGGRPIKILGPLKTTRSLKIILSDDLNNPIPRDFKYESPSTGRVKMIRITYNGQPWFCRSCETHHNNRFCPLAQRDHVPFGARNTIDPPSDKIKTVMLSALETRLFDPSSTDVKLVRWPGGRLGHLANMVDDEDLAEVNHLILVGGLNDISMDTKETKESSKFHILKLFEVLKLRNPKHTSIIGPYICPGQANYSDSRRIINARLR